MGGDLCQYSFTQNWKQLFFSQMILKYNLWPFCVAGYRQVELTEEQLKRREQRANKRKQMAQEKREKDKVQYSGFLIAGCCCGCLCFETFK